MLALWPAGGGVRRAVLATCLAVGAAFLFALLPAHAQAHQNGCHRWHSCPSDTGSYVCGDLGYTSGCPGGTPTTTPPTPTVSAPAGASPPDAASFTIGQGTGVTFTVDSPGGTPSITLSTGNVLGTYGLLTASAYPVVLLPTSVDATTYTATLPWNLFAGTSPILAAGTYYWQAYIFDASACATSGCYVAGPVQSFTVAAPPPPPPAATTPNALPGDSGACADDRRRRDRLTAQVNTLRRQLAKTKNRAKRARLRRKLNSRRSALADARDAMASDC